ncbi:MAG: LysE family transporter [Syntrophales bacterium]|jgi:threonine/homoserine/homoserine lactone efflux protein
MLSYVLQAIIYGFAAAVQPGPFQAYIISQTLTNGARHTLPSALAPLFSDGPIIVLVLLILSKVPASILLFLRIIGGLYILYLSAGAFRACRAIDSYGASSVQSTGRGLLKAVFVNILNPSAYLYWSLVTGPILLMGWREAHIVGVGFLIGFYIAAIATLIGVILLFAASNRLGPAVNRALRGVSAAALVCFGVYQISLGAVEYFKMLY